MRRFALLVVVTLLAGAGGTSSAATGGLALGTYEEVTTCTVAGCGFDGTFTHTFTITSSDPVTGAIAGTFDGGAGTVAGTVSGATITMTWSRSDGYVAQLDGTIDANGNMAGNASDNAGNHTTWTGSPDVGCSVATSAARDLIVPAGTTCQPGASDTIGHDIVVGNGATLIDRGATVGNDIRASAPAAVGIGFGGSVGNDVVIDGTTGALGGVDNYLCNTRVGHDVVVQNSAPTAGPWDIGDDPECTRGGLTIANDLVVRNNAVHVDVSENGTNTGPDQPGHIGHDLTVTGNTTATVEGNVVGNDALCRPIQTTADRDGDALPNTVAVIDDGCDGQPAPPVLTSPADGASIMGTHDVHVAGTADAGAAVTVYVDGSPVQTLSADATASFDSSVAVAYGTHTLAVSQTVDGVEGPQTAARSIALAPAAPTLASPADGSSIVGSTDVHVTGTAEPAATVTAYVDGASTALSAADAAGSFSFTTSVGYGAHSIRVSQTVGGVESSQTAPHGFTVVPAAPTLTAPANGTTVGSTTVTVSGTGVPFALVEVSDAGVAVASTTVDATGVFATAVTLGLGPHTLTATQTAGGETSAASAADAVTVDIAPTITAPADGALFATSSFAVSGTALPNTVVRVFAGTTDLGSFVADASGAFSGTVTLADGVYSVTARQMANGFVSSASNALTITVDTTPPVLHVPANVTSTNPVVTYTVTATDAIDPSPTVSCAPPSGSTFPVGTTVVACTATDRAGNTATGSFTVTVVDPIAELLADVQELTGTHLPPPALARLTALIRAFTVASPRASCVLLGNVEAALRSAETAHVTQQQRDLLADMLGDVAAIRASLGCRS